MNQNPFQLSQTAEHNEHTVTPTSRRAARKQNAQEVSKD